VSASQPLIIPVDADDPDSLFVLRRTRSDSIILPADMLTNGFVALDPAILTGFATAEPLSADGTSWRQRLGRVGDALTEELSPDATSEDLLNFLAANPEILGPHVEATAGLVRREIDVVDPATQIVTRTVTVLVPVESLDVLGSRLFGVFSHSIGDWSNSPLSRKNSPAPQYRIGTARLETTRSLRAATNGIEDPLELHAPGISADWDHTYSRFFAPLLVAPRACGPTSDFRDVTARYLGLDSIAKFVRIFFDIDATDSVLATRDMFKATVSETYRDSCGEDDWIADRVLNGVHPCHFRTGQPNEYIVDLNWNNYAFSYVGDLSHLSAHETSKLFYEQPNVRASFQLSPHDESFTLQSISIQYRNADVLEPVDNSPEKLGQWTKYTPGSGRYWTYAKHVFRCAWLLAGETDYHLARCHLLAEQYLAALRTCVETGYSPREGAYQAAPANTQHPFWRLLEPFLRDVDRINAFGDALVIGPTGVVSAMSALASSAVASRVEHQLAGLDWKGFRPRGAVCPTHRFALAANIYWDTIHQYVAKEVSDNWHVYLADWAPIKRFSDALTGRSPRYKPYGGDDNPATWHDTREMASPRAADQPSMSLIGDQNQDDVVQLATHAIYHATFMHSWINDRQWDDCADPYFTSFGLMSRRPPEPDETPEHWLREALPLVKHAAFQRALMTMLAHLDVGYVARVNSEPVYRGLEAYLRTRADDLAAIGKLGRYSSILLKSAAQPEFGVETAITQLRARINT
jgi:hypothetical protein